LEKGEACERLEQGFSGSEMEAHLAELRPLKAPDLGRGGRGSSGLGELHRLWTECNQLGGGHALEQFLHEGGLAIKQRRQILSVDLAIQAGQPLILAQADADIAARLMIENEAGFRVGLRNIQLNARISIGINGITRTNK